VLEATLQVLGATTEGERFLALEAMLLLLLLLLLMLLLLLVLVVVLRGEL
jgi:hypothetical protein